jgi:poly(hydroxyalkanoate) depolymerase family esterase
VNENFVVALRRAAAQRWRRIGQATAALQESLTGCRSDRGGDGPEAGEPQDAAAGAALRETFEAEWPGAMPVDASGFAEHDEHWTGAAPVTEPAARPRRSLRDAVRILRDGHDRLTPAARQRDARAQNDEIEADVAGGAGFHRRTFTCEAGGRDYRLYVPRLEDQSAEGLILMLHGCTQTPEDFAAGTGMNAFAEAHHLLIAYPEQTEAHNAMQCWNWFRRNDQARGTGEPAVLASLASHLAEEFDVPGNRIFVAGMSAGGAMAAILADAYPDLFEAVGVHSGVAPGLATDALSAFSAMRGDFVNGTHRPVAFPPEADRVPRIIVFHGESDRTVHPANGRRLALMAQGAFDGGLTRTEDGVSARGRSYRRMVLEEPTGAPLVESWMVQGAGHAWSGGCLAGSHTDPDGPDASGEMIRFFLAGPGAAEQECH